MSSPSGSPGSPYARSGVSLPALAARVGAVGAGGDGDSAIPDVIITGVTLRGQDARPGDLFAALPGSTAHGAKYAADAVAGGAVAVLTDNAGAEVLGPAVGVPVLVHPDPRGVLGALAAEVAVIAVAILVTSWIHARKASFL